MCRLITGFIFYAFSSPKQKKMIHDFEKMFNLVGDFFRQIPYRRLSLNPTGLLCPQTLPSPTPVQS